MNDKEEKALGKVNEILSLDLARTYSKVLEFKGVKSDEDDGGRCKFYLDRSELVELADAFKILSEASDVEEKK